MGYNQTAALLKFSYLLHFKFSCAPVPGALCSTKSARFMGSHEDTANLYRAGTPVHGAALLQSKLPSS